MMPVRYHYRILNVFTVDGTRLSGNPLCVFEDGRGLADAQMQALALQFNLSETVFILPAPDAGATATVRIFTPAMELPFAGHPILGSAFVVRDLMSTGGVIRLNMRAGTIAVSAQGDTWTFSAGAPVSRQLEATRIGALAAALGLPRASLAATPRWVSTGIEQLLVPLGCADAVDAAVPNVGLLAFANDFDKVGVYVFSPLTDAAMRVRFFFGKAAGAIAEDPATGSACANLGGYALAIGAPLPLRRELSQGERTGRPSRLALGIDVAGTILVSGEVIELGRGHFDL